MNIYTGNMTSMLVRPLDSPCSAELCLVETNKSSWWSSLKGRKLLKAYETNWMQVIIWIQHTMKYAVRSKIP